MSKPTMTPKDVEALETARREWRASVDAFEQVIQDNRPLADVDAAQRTLEQKQAEYRSVYERFMSYIMG